MLGVRIIACSALVFVACGGGNEAQRGRSHFAAASGTTEARTCASDLVCPIGFVCAKRAGAFTGDCLRSVDENGAPVVVRHSVDSYRAGPLTCTTTSDCPSAFRCDEGRCIR